MDSSFSFRREKNLAINADLTRYWRFQDYSGVYLLPEQRHHHAAPWRQDENVIL